MQSSLTRVLLPQMALSPLALAALALLVLQLVPGAQARARAEPVVPSPSDTFVITPPDGPLELPSFLHVCRRSDPDLNNCVCRAVESLRPQLAQGIPLLGVPPCEPLRVPTLSLEQGRGAVAVRAEYSDVRVWGVADVEARAARVDMNRGRARLRLRFPQLRLRCRYRLAGRVLMLPVRGRGDARGNYTDVEATVSLQGREEERDGHSFLAVRSLAVELSIGHAAVHLDGLFDGDKELGEAMNLFLNDNWRNVAEEMRPALEQAVADLCLQMARAVFDRFPLSQLLPP